MSRDILQEIVAKKTERLHAAEARLSLGELWRRLEEKKPERRPWSILPGQFGLIAEVKKASPSKGQIAWGCALPELVSGYEQGGAGAISVLTEEDFFLGSLADLATVRGLTGLPLLRKDFMWTEYQLVESRVHGADAVLLIVAMLSGTALAALLQLAGRLELEVLVECHNRAEVEIALQAGAKMIGINNRDLRTFAVSLQTTRELAVLIPPTCTLVSESGIKAPEDAATVAQAGANAVLVGESCVRQGQPAAHIEALLAAGRRVYSGRLQTGKGE